MTNEELLFFICFNVLINIILQNMAFIIGKKIGYKRELERLHKRREAERMKEQLVICDKCKHSNPKDLIQGIVYCHYWNYCFNHLDKCGNFEPRKEDE